jgi:hypothetical protein
MKLIHADPDRKIEIEGVSAPVPRPVDIDKQRTGFANLRSLRIYRFGAGVAIDGHAEEDEVFVVALEGSVAFTAKDEGGEEVGVFHLSAPDRSQTVTCAAYLPPNAAYHLVAENDAIIAYARATPPTGAAPAAFRASGSPDDKAVQILLDERTYAQRLELKLLHVDAAAGALEFQPVSGQEATQEALVHLQHLAGVSSLEVSNADAGTAKLTSWETLALLPGETPTIHFPQGSSALVLVVRAA